MCTVLITAMASCPSTKGTTGLETKTSGQHKGAE